MNAYTMSAYYPTTSQDGRRLMLAREPAGDGPCTGCGERHEQLWHFVVAVDAHGRATTDGYGCWSEGRYHSRQCFRSALERAQR